VASDLVIKVIPLTDGDGVQQHTLLVTLASHCIPRFVSLPIRIFNGYLTLKICKFHAQALALGGNQIVAKCDGNSTNLHAIWGEYRNRFVNVAPVQADIGGLLPLSLDFSMLTKTADALYNGSSQTYASELANRITVTLTFITRLY
jgi:hypothetical protein